MNEYYYLFGINIWIDTWTIYLKWVEKEDMYN